MGTTAANRRAQEVDVTSFSITMHTESLIFCHRRDLCSLQLGNLFYYYYINTFAFILRPFTEFRNTGEFLWEESQHILVCKFQGALTLPSRSSRLAPPPVLT
jgi:hypothetical protein